VFTVRTCFVCSIAAIMLGCSHSRSIDSKQLKQELTTSRSLAAEAALLTDSIASAKLTETFAREHAEYLQEKIKKELDELEGETPSPQAAGAYRQALNSLREMEAAVHTLSSQSPERQDLIRLRKAFEQAAQALRTAQAAP